MNILQLLASSSFITLNKNVIKAVGLEEALILGELSSEYDYWLKRGEIEDGWFFSTVENIENNTTLNDYKQRKAINNLEKMDLIQVKVKGIPAKRFFRINQDHVLKILDIQYSKNLSYSSEKIKELDTENFECNKNIINNNKDNNNNINNIYSDSGKPEHPTHKKESKHIYGEYNHVRLTDTERDRLFNDYGESETLAAIKYLDEYIEMYGKKYKNHNLVLRKWVFTAVKEKKVKSNKPQTVGTTGAIDWDNV